MKFEEIGLRSFNGQWAERKISPIIFKDCSVSVWIDEYGGRDQEEDQTPLAERVRITASLECTGEIGKCHVAAYDHFVANAEKYEQRLLDFLFEISERNLRNSTSFDEEGEVRELIEKHGLHSVAGLKKQIEWVGLTLFDHGWDDIGFITMDFGVGWDEEHGISVLMHTGRIIASSGLADFSNRGETLIAHAKYCQDQSVDVEL